MQEGHNPLFYCLENSGMTTTINRILAIQQIEGAAKLLRAEVSYKTRVDSYGNTNQVVEFVLPVETAAPES